MSKTNSNIQGIQPSLQLPTPDTFWLRFLKQPYGYDAGIAIFSSFAGIGGALALYGRNELWPAFFLTIGTIIVMIFGVAKTIVFYQKQRHDDSMHDLEGCLYTLISALRSTIKEGDEDPGLRAAIFAPSKNGSHMIQLMSYVGDIRAGETGGRLLGVATGTIGLAYRLNASIIASRASEDHEGYLEELVAAWGFTKEEALERDPRAFSWFAVPIEVEYSENPVHYEEASVTIHGASPAGILYLDSTSVEFFDDEIRADLVEYSTLGIADFCKKRYTSDTSEAS